jgi:flagellar basal body rod protein FlgF
MPSELLLTNLDNVDLVSSEEVVNVEESSVISALKVEDEEQHLEELDALKLILMDTKSSVDEKNEAFDKMKSLDIKKAEEEKLQDLVKENLELDSFIKIDGSNIKVVVDSNDKNSTTANKIMRYIQSQYDAQKYITVEFK